MSSLPSPSWRLPTSLLLLSLVPLTAGAVRLAGLAGGGITTPENARFMAAPCGILSALTGVWMTVGTAIPAQLQGGLLYGVRILAGLAMALAIVVSVRAVLRRRVAQHKAWMVRAYALGQGAGTQVLIMLPVSLIAGAPTFFFRDVLMASAWGLNVLFAEWIIRRRLRSI